MFPQNSYNSSKNENTENNNKIISTELCYTPDYNPETSQTVIKNGNVELIKDYRNIRNWFIKFIFTPVNAIPIYAGTDFGTSLLKIRGQKSLFGIEMVQLKKEIQTGAKLHPAIKEIQDVKLYKVGTSLFIKIVARLIYGVIWTDKIEAFKIYE